MPTNISIDNLKGTGENILKSARNTGRLELSQGGNNGMGFSLFGPITSLPKELFTVPGYVEHVTELNLNGNKLKTIPKEIGNWKNLEVLNLNDNEISSLPKEIGDLTNLKDLYLGRNKLKMLPKEIGNLKNLEILHLGNNDFKVLPKELGNLKNLEVITAPENPNLTSIPKELVKLKKLRILDLRRNPLLREIPGTLIRRGLKVYKNDRVRFININQNLSVKRINVPLNTNRNDAISYNNFKVGNNAVNIGYNRYVSENTFRKLAKMSVQSAYILDSNENIAQNPFTRKPLLRKNIKFVKFVKPNTNKKPDKK